jgi:hypothetical protein
LAPRRALNIVGHIIMKALTLTVAICFLSATAQAQSPNCKAQATEKKLAGAALNSFMKRCERDANKTCDTSAKEQKLAGAAKTSFTKKCVSDAVGQ